MTLGEGRTPLPGLVDLMRDPGLARIEVKVKARNLTPSCKDRNKAAASPLRGSSEPRAPGVPPGITVPPWPSAQRPQASGVLSSSLRDAPFPVVAELRLSRGDDIIMDPGTCESVGGPVERLFREHG